MTFAEQIQAQLAARLTPEQQNFFGSCRATPLFEEYLIWSYEPGKAKAYVEVVRFGPLDRPENDDCVKRIRNIIERCALRLQLAVLCEYLP